MAEITILSEEILKTRRYPWVVKNRKTWKCRRCGLIVEKGGGIEHSYTTDMTISIALCLPCVEILEKQTGEK